MSACLQDIAEAQTKSTSKFFLLHKATRVFALTRRLWLELSPGRLGYASSPGSNLRSVVPVGHFFFLIMVSWADMLEEDSYDGELERLHDQDWTKATTASLRAAEGSRLTEKQERKMQSSKSGGEHTSQGMTELMPKQAAGHRPGVLTGNGAGDGSGGGPGAGEDLSRSARRRQRRKAKTHKPR